MAQMGLTGEVSAELRNALVGLSLPFLSCVKLITLLHMPTSMVLCLRIPVHNALINSVKLGLQMSQNPTKVVNLPITCVPPPSVCHCSSDQQCNN